MARKIRLEYAGACYHVINRGNYRRDLFARKGAAESFQQSQSKRPWDLRFADEGMLASWPDYITQAPAD